MHWDRLAMSDRYRCNGWKGRTRGRSARARCEKERQLCPPRSKPHALKQRLGCTTRPRKRKGSGHTWANRPTFYNFAIRNDVMLAKRCQSYRFTFWNAVLHNYGSGETRARKQRNALRPGSRAVPLPQLLPRQAVLGRGAERPRSSHSNTLLSKHY